MKRREISACQLFLCGLKQRRGEKEGVEETVAAGSLLWISCVVVVAIELGSCC